MAKVCLDAGHYGKYNRSPVVPEYYESDMTWKLHNYLAVELEAYGIEVVHTRSSKDADLDLFVRGCMAAGCDLFVSLHSNAFGSEAVDYPLACCLVDDDKTGIDEISMEIGLDLAKCVQRVMGTTGTARTMQKKLNSGADYYGVLRGAKSVGVPGVLLEHSFHTNTRAAKWLMNDANLRRMACSEANVIADRLGVAAPGSDAEDVLYRVQTGAFVTKANAQRQLEKLLAAGFAACLVKVGVWYKVQVGAFRYELNAKEMLKRLTTAGYKGMITTNTAKAVSVTTPEKTVDELAREVIAGKWGVNPERKQRLQAAGYDYNAVRARVNYLLD